jgi:Tol biopolymer transport system component
MQLTFPPLYAMMPRWSPQGGKIAFFEFESGTGKPAGMYEISAAGGTPRRLAPSETQHQKDPNWSPDGSRIVFGGEANDPASSIRVLDLATNQVSMLPDSHGMFSPRWSPDGRRISACSADSMRLYVFDLQTRKWTEIAKGPLGWTNWSRDGDFIYLLDFRGSGAVRRIRLADARFEQVLDLKNFVTAGRYDGSLTLAPDDSPLLLRYTGSQDIYAADWNQP